MMVLQRWTGWSRREREVLLLLLLLLLVFWGDHHINIIDTPGHVDFTVEVERALRVLDGGVAVFDGSQGVEPQSETVWRQADKYNVPRIAFVNKMDKMGADFNMSIESIEQRLTNKAVPIQMPVGAASTFEGIVDLIKLRYYTFAGDHGEQQVENDIPAELMDEVNEAREVMLDKLSDLDDQIAEKYLDGADISVEEIKAALRRGVVTNSIYPVLCGSALKNKGVQKVLDAVDRLPPVSARPSTSDHWNHTLTTGEELERESTVDASILSISYRIQDFMTDPFVGTLTLILPSVLRNKLQSGESGPTTLSQDKRRE